MDRQVLGGYAAGVVLARIAGLILPISIGPFALTLSALAFPVLFWTGSRMAMRGGRRARPRLALGIAAGIVGDELVYLAFRTEGIAYWSAVSLAGSLVIAGLAVGAVVVFARIGGREARGPADRWVALASAGIVGCSYVGYRLSQGLFRLAGLPNEQRSIVLGGFEVHHASTGSFLLVIAALVLGMRGLDVRTRRGATLAFALGSGFVADEYPYIFFPVLTDALYFGPVSAVGGAVSTAIVITFLAYNYRISRREGTEA